MRQRPPMFRHNARLASIEPPLAKWAPGKVFGLERSALVCAASAIGHLRRLQSLQRYADVPGRELWDTGEALVPPATLRFWPDPSAPLQVDARRPALIPAALRAPCATSPPQRCDRHRNDGGTVDCSRLNSHTGGSTPILD